jgi:uncharacterized protein
MAGFQDPSGAFVSAWQPAGMGSFRAGKSEPGTFGWAQLNARGIDKATGFYQEVFGWTAKTSPMGDDQPPYTEFHLGDRSIACAIGMNLMVPAGVPSYWMVHFDVADVDDAFKRAIDAGGREMLAPDDYPGGRYAILPDPHGAPLGLLKGK